MLKKYLSYFIPVKIYDKKSAISKTLEVTWNNGQLVLDSKNTNYSYGSLQRILRIGLKNIGFETIRNMNSVLVLGVGAGSVIKTLYQEIGCKGKITGVELDAETINIANRFFSLNKIPNLEIIIDDAFEFVLKTKTKYNLIIIDVFQDTIMPNFLFESFFTERLCFLLDMNGFILFNTMILSEKDEKRNKDYLTLFNPENYNVKTLPRLEQHNELILIKKNKP